MILTLKDIRDQHPCENGWRTLIKSLGTKKLTTELSIGDVVLSNGLDDALWCLRCLPTRERVAAIMPAVRRASTHTTDQRVHDCIADVQRWLDGDDSVDLAAARDAAGAAARAATWDAAGAAARAAAWTAAGAAARAAAWAAAGTAAGTAARDAERNRQRADLLTMFPPIRLEDGIPFSFKLQGENEIRS